MSFDRMIEKIVETQNPTVAGLDPKLAYIPSYILDGAVAKYGKTLEAAAAALLEYNKGLIDALCDIVPAVKPQAAYYEMYGWQGVRTLAETVAYARAKGMFVITDGKRNDIGTTMEAYATAHLGKTDVFGEKTEAFGADALTVNGYLGTDGIKPLLGVCEAEDKGIFVLVKTSNPSSGELQDQKMESGKTVYETMGEFCEHWGESVMGKYGYSGVGAVVGATYPHSSAKCARRRRTRSSSCPVTAHRAAARMTLPRRLTRTVSAPSSIPPAALCAHGRRKSATSMTMHRRQDAKPFACATRSAHASAKFARTDE